MLKFMYSEKTTKFILFPFDTKNFVAFSKNLKFTLVHNLTINITLYSPLSNHFKVLTSSIPRNTDTRRLNLKFYGAKIQIPFPNKYLGYGYKGFSFL